MQVFTATLKINSAGKQPGIPMSGREFPKKKSQFACRQSMATHLSWLHWFHFWWWWWCVCLLVVYRWQWSRFVRRAATEINATIYSAPDPAMISGPLDDADGRPTGTHKAPLILRH
jgi:hypothetical protein